MIDLWWITTQIQVFVGYKIMYIYKPERVDIKIPAVFNTVFNFHKYHIFTITTSIVLTLQIQLFQKNSHN